MVVYCTTVGAGVGAAGGNDDVVLVTITEPCGFGVVYCTTVGGGAAGESDEVVLVIMTDPCGFVVVYCITVADAVGAAGNADVVLATITEPWRLVEVYSITVLDCGATTGGAGDSELNALGVLVLGAEAEETMRLLEASVDLAYSRNSLNPPQYSVPSPEQTTSEAPVAEVGWLVK